MRFRILGALEVEVEGRPLVLGGPKQRAVLAHLLLRANHVVPSPVLIGALWGEEPPEAARGTLQAYVSRLRSILGEGQIEGRAPGYVLHVDPGELDAERFESLVRDARADAAQDPALAIASLEEALALWRGPALADLSDEVSLQGEIARLEELRLGALEEKVSAELAVGRHTAVVGELEALTRQHPLRERLWGELMLALYRSGRQAEALEAFRRAQQVLVDELGIDPSRRLQRLHERILAQDPELSSPSRPIPVPPRPSAAPGELAPDTALAGYRIEDVLGRGGMSTVYLAEDLRLRRRIALKVLSPELSREPGFRERFVRESQVAAGLEHPGIVPIYEAGEAEGNLYIAMRYVRGTDLRRLIAERGPLDPERAIRIVRHVAEALDAAHAEGLVHRDVKPANILLLESAEDEGRDLVYLSDFGLTKRLEGSGGPRTRTGQFVGTVEYVAPEQIEGRPVDGRADVYSLACVLFECLTGRSPFRRDTEVATLYAHLQEEPPRLSEDRPDLPPELDAVLARAAAKDPKERFGSCRELAAAAREAIAPRGHETSRPRGAGALLARPWAIGIVAAAVAVGGIGIALTSRSPQAAPGPVGSISPTPSPHFATLDRPFTSDERRLLALIPRGIGASCAPYQQPPAILASGDDPAGAVACDTGAVDVLYELFNDRGSMDAAFGKRAHEMDAFGGECVSDATAQNAYTVQGRSAGRVLCSRDTDGSTIAWTDERVLVFAEAFRGDLGDLSLYEWWRGAGPLVSGSGVEKDAGGRIAAPPEGTYLSFVSSRDDLRIRRQLGISDSFEGSWAMRLADGTYTVTVPARFSDIQSGTVALGKGPRLLLTSSCDAQGALGTASYRWRRLGSGSVELSLDRTYEAARKGSCVPGPWPVTVRPWLPAPAGEIVFSSATNQLVGVSLSILGYTDLSAPGGSGHDNIEGTWSPDGGRLLFASNRDGDFDLYVIDADGSNLEQLTDDPGDELDPAWSPDGTRIAYERLTPGEPRSRTLSVLSLSDGTVTDIVAREGDVGHPAWSPDGSAIAFRIAQGQVLFGRLVSIYVVNPDGSGLTRLVTEENVVDSAPAWTPDGRRILFWGDRGSTSEVFLSMRPDGSDVRPLEVSLPSTFLTLDWSPDGRWMVLGGAWNATSPLYLVSADGADVFVLENSAGEPRWRPTTS